MLPNTFPALPERLEFDIYAVMEPAKEVSRDFYDFFPIDENYLCLVIADISGKGVPAALFRMASEIVLASCAVQGNSAAEILTRINENICSNNREDMFFTVCLGVLELSTGALTAANAEDNIFGTERKLAALNRETDVDPKWIVKNVRTAVGAFVQEAD